MMGKGDKYVGFITASSEQEAKKIARTLVEKRLAACVNIVPSIQSIYRWEGKILEEAESLLIFKTSKDRFDELKRVVEKLHSYSTPEIIAMDIDSGSQKYLRWIEKSLEK